MRTTTRRDGAHVKRDHNDTGRNIDRDTDGPVTDTRQRFGGLDGPAAFAGTMAALGMLAVLAAIAGAWSTAYDQTLNRDEVVSVTGLVIGLAIVVVASLFGGWVAGRTARYNGTGNGLLTGLLLLLFTAGLGWLLGATADQATSFEMPSWITADATSNEALISAAVAAGLALLVCALGGALGSHWHRRVDRALVTETENNAFAPYPEDQRLVTAPPVHEGHEADVTDSSDEVVAEPTKAKRTTTRTARSRSAD